MNKRAFANKFNIEPQLLDSFCASGIIPFEKMGRMIYIDEASVSCLIEGYHYITCPKCGKKMANLTKVHPCHVSPNLYSGLFLERHKKTPVQKQAQSEKLKKRFMTSEGEETKRVISRTSKERFENPVYKESQRAKFTQYQRSMENREKKSIESFERWSDPEFRAKMERYVEENHQQLANSARKARQFLNKQSKLHIKYKENMIRMGLQGFISEYAYGPYSVDEADPLAKVAVEVDGCYWHGCQACGYQGDKKIMKTDKSKTTFLKNRGWVIIRIKEHELLKNPIAGIESIRTIQAIRRKANMDRIRESMLSGELKVRSMVDKGLEPQWVPMSNILRHNTPHKKMVKITTDLGAVIVTEDHSLFSWKTKEPVRASDLRIGDLIVGLPIKEFEPVKVTEMGFLPPEEHTYDVSVPGSENAVLNSGILVHNTYSISGVSLDIEKSSKYQALKDEYIAEYDKLVEQNKLSIKIAVGLRQYKYGVGVTSALGPLSRPGVQSRRNLLSAGQGGF